MLSPRYQTLYARKIKAYQWLYEFTRSQCHDCSRTDCACKDSICAHVEQQAALRGHHAQHTGYHLRFIGCNGCVIPPHLRETCTIYLCDQAQVAPSFERARYQRLKNLCAKLEAGLMECTTPWDSV